MLLKGSLLAAALFAGVAASAGIILNDAPVFGPAGDTLSLAPISLGNPSTAATLTTRWSVPPQEEEAEAVPPIYQVALRINRGDTLAGLLTDAGVSAADAQAASTALSKRYNPKRIAKGQEIAVRFMAPALGTAESRSAGPGRFVGLQVEPDYNTAIIVERADTGDGFTASTIEKTLTRTLTRAEGVIKSSLYVSGRESDIPNPVLVELIRAYSWDVDFQRDIRAGDSFKVMYERVFDEHGNHVHSGNIRFAQLTLSGNRHTIYRHRTKDGDDDYFDEKGQSARKALMRTPIDGARLSSGFGHRRHPILGYTKMHQGVDFAAPRGTPIYAAGNGTIVKAGANGAYGIYIQIRHNDRYSTAYAHMKGLARNSRRGNRVTQGQIIGYVGTTGRSTGPHLHYEILSQGQRTNPMKVKMPSGRKLKGDALEAFQAARQAVDETFASLTPEAKVAEAGD
ncbi:MAG: M23 family metallopeptidase [Proteobacteria bacterium]|nr:M23 family metallopeptidase [Pseudomonadota bacterium]